MRLRRSWRVVSHLLTILFFRNGRLRWEMMCVSVREVIVKEHLKSASIL